MCVVCGDGGGDGSSDSKLQKVWPTGPKISSTQVHCDPKHDNDVANGISEAFLLDCNAPACENNIKCVTAREELADSGEVAVVPENRLYFLHTPKAGGTAVASKSVNH